jgi:N-carbamoyl-L-amino-acid hydrolase
MSVVSMPFVHGDRLNHNLDTLAEIGKLPQGGVRRISFSQEDQLARQLVKNWMTEAGMTTCTDAAGNLIGRYPGRKDLPSLATGSHIDTVPSAGKYDGTLGVLAGIEVVRALKFNDIMLDHPVEVIVFTDEENTMIGGKAMAGTHQPDPTYYQTKDGLTIQERLKRVGGDWEAIASARRSRKDMAAFVELHVEQGGVLESQKAEIGVVEGVVSMNRYTLSVTGSPNHAGTTPMNMRQDALVAASQIVLTVNQLANYLPGDQVATVGMMNVWPNATNIVPGRVDLSLDIRDLYTENVQALVKRLVEQIDAIANQTGTKIEMEQTLNAEPSLSSPQIMNAITEASQEQGLRHMKLPSRAGHDAQEMGRITDMGMIFVPSRGGISHSEDEFTPPEQCTQGADILLSTLMKLDALYD